MFRIFSDDLHLRRHDKSIDITKTMIFADEHNFQKSLLILSALTMDRQQQKTDKLLSDVLKQYKDTNDDPKELQFLTSGICTFSDFHYFQIPR